MLTMVSDSQLVLDVKHKLYGLYEAITETDKHKYPLFCADLRKCSDMFYPSIFLLYFQFDDSN